MCGGGDPQFGLPHTVGRDCPLLPIVLRNLAREKSLLCFKMKEQGMTPVDVPLEPSKLGMLQK